MGSRRLFCFVLLQFVDRAILGERGILCERKKNGSGSGVVDETSKQATMMFGCQVRFFLCAFRPAEISERGNGVKEGNAQNMQLYFVWGTFAHDVNLASTREDNRA